MQVKGIPWMAWEDHIKELTAPIDQAWLKWLLWTKAQVIDSLQNYNYAGALESIEKNFWSFCDNYLEMVKARVYQLKDRTEGLSGKRALDYSLYIFLKLFAPYFPYVTEEVWQSRYNKESPSIHNSIWLDKSALKKTEERLNHLAPSHFDEKSILKNAFTILEQVRSQKSALSKSLASSLKNLEITASPDHLKEFELYKGDIARASHVHIKDIVTIEQALLEKPIVKITFEDCVDPG